GDGDPGTEVVVVLVEKLVCLAERTVGNPLKHIPAVAKIEITVQVPFAIRAVQNPEVFPAQSRGECDSWSQLKGVFRVPGEFVVAVMAREARWLNRAVDGWIVGLFRQDSVWVEGHAEVPVRDAIQH